MKCLILANKVNNELFPLTKEVPTGLLPMKGKPIVEWILEELEAVGDVQYLMATCDVYESEIQKWKQEKSYGEKISLLKVSKDAQEEEILECLCKEGTESDVLVIPSDTIFDFSLKEVVKAFQDSDSPLIFVHGNEMCYEELPVHFYTKELLNTGEPLGDRKNWERVYIEDYYYPIDSLTQYEDLEDGKFGHRIHDKFEVKAFTQERYGDVFVSEISMDRKASCKQMVQAEIVICNRSQKVMDGENTRITYKLWLEEPRPGSYIMDRIPIQTEDVYLLPCKINPREDTRVKLDVKLPGICGKYFLKFDIEVDGQWLAEGAHYLLFPTVTFCAEAASDLSMEELIARPKVVFVGMPESANAGEHLEAVAMKDFVQKIFPDRPCLEYPARNVEEYWRNCGKIVHPDDLVFVYGSGFMGTPEKMAEEHFRRRTASSVAMPKIRLRMFIPPVHQAFLQSEDGKEQVKHSATAYGGTNYYLYGANEEDYQFFLKEFEKTNVAKAPILSFGLGGAEDKEPAGDDFTVVVCGGSKEGFLDKAFEAIDKNNLRRMFLNLDYNAYQPGAFFGKKGRDYLIKFCSDTILDTKAVVTDNHFGLAYALMCKRPCVVYGESLDKEWFADRDDVIFIERLEDMEAACKEVLKRKGKGPLKEEYYLPLKRQISM